MSFSHGQHAWPPPGGPHLNGNRPFHHLDDLPPRTQTPVDHPASLMPEASDIELDHRRAHFAHLSRKMDDALSAIFTPEGDYNHVAIKRLTAPRADPAPLPLPATDHTPIREPPRKKAKRDIDEDNYDDEDDEDDDDDDGDEPNSSQFKYAKSAAPAINAAASLLSPSKSGSSPVHSDTAPDKPSDKNQDGAEETRKQLEDAKNATRDEAMRSSFTIFHTLENDRTAMLEQEKLEESEKQLQAEMDKNHGNATSAPGEHHGSLSSANLGASSLTLKHLIARIDAKRDQVRASDSELRLLMNEVRKNRSKWASEENVGQEELYEALEKVLSELKAHTEYSTPFLTRVNKREAPDYYNIIKHPMDLGSMTKKLKQLAYKSKSDFVTDLNLIWDNCLKYNQTMSHPLRRMANGMRKEAEKLIPLIPDLTVRSRAEVEAEERRKQLGADDDGGDDSDDEPIMSSRGRKAGTQKMSNKSRKAHGDVKEGTPGLEQKPVLQLNGLLAKPHREGSEIDGSNGFATPPIGSITPGGPNGISGIGSNADAMDIDGPSLNGIDLGPPPEQVYESEEYKVWKQITKKDRARITKQRYNLFKGGKLNVDEPALLRTRAGIRKTIRKRKMFELGIYTPSKGDSAIAAEEGPKAAETLAEGIQEQGEEDSMVPDYYEPLNVIPDIPHNLQWVTDGEGEVVNQHEEFLKVLPPGYCTAPPSKLTIKMDANLAQIQETRKLCSKIGVIKQMQIQAQVYANQFSKYNPEPFVEQDIEPHFYTGDTPLISRNVSRHALQRSVGKLFYHAGFEELQPSALDTITDLAGDFMQRLIKTFNTYREAEKKEVTNVNCIEFKPRFTPEEVILHTLTENGTDPDVLEAYARDDVDRLGNKLGTIHERMKAHLAELLRPALNDAGPDGAGAFNDGSEQFVSGDFAEELGDDFFGFKALGLDKEMGLDSLSVPLHLLQSRVRSQFQQTQTAGPTGVANLFEELPPLEPVNKDTVEGLVGLAKAFFKARLASAKEGVLIDDEDLPVKQRRPRPRLGATGKIVSPQKRPPKEQIALAKKKKKLEMQAAANGSPDKKKQAGASAGGKVTVGPGSHPNLQLAPPMSRGPSMQSLAGSSQEIIKDEVGVPISPESMER